MSIYSLVLVCLLLIVSGCSDKEQEKFKDEIKGAVEEQVNKFVGHIKEELNKDVVHVVMKTKEGFDNSIKSIRNGVPRFRIKASILSKFPQFVNIWFGTMFVIKLKEYDKIEKALINCPSKISLYGYDAAQKTCSNTLENAVIFLQKNIKEFNMPYILAAVPEGLNFRYKYIQIYLDAKEVAANELVNVSLKDFGLSLDEDNYLNKAVCFYRHESCGS